MDQAKESKSSKNNPRKNPPEEKILPGGFLCFLFFLVYYRGMAKEAQLAKELEKIVKKFLDENTRKVLFKSLKGDKTEWFYWVSEIKRILEKLSKSDANKFTALLLLLETGPKSRFHQNNLKKFLIDRIEYYKYYDFGVDRELAKKEKTSKKIWISKIFRLFISRSFLGILILVLIVGFILWFYLDRESCLEFVQKVVSPFIKGIK